MINQIEPSITEVEMAEINKCISSTFVTEGKYTDLFEKSVMNFHRCKLQPVAYANATLGLYAALKVLGLQPGQEVIIPALTFVATANAILMAGGKPVCVDIDEEFRLKADDVVENINQNTFGIMPVHLYGHFTNVTEIKEICKKYGLKLIEDASQGVGVSENGTEYAGSIGDIGVLSFYGNKFVTSAQGAMILSNDQSLMQDLRRLKNHGRDTKGTFWHETIGFNFCTSDLHSALGYSQLVRFEEIKNRKLEIFQKYEAELQSSDIKLDKIINNDPAYWFVSIWHDSVESLADYLKSKGIQTRRAFPPLALQPCYNDNKNIIFKSYKTAAQIYNKYLSLPSSFSLEDTEITRICDELRKF